MNREGHMLTPINDDAGRARHISEHVGNIRKRIEREGANEPIKSGLDDLDRVIGGFYPGELIVVGGRPGMGKTGFALGIVRQFAGDSKPVLYFGLGAESGDQLTARLCGFESLEKSDDRRTLAGWQHWFLDSQAQLNEKLPIYIDDDPNIDIDELCRRVRLHSEHVERVELVVVENLHLLCVAQGIEQRKWPAKMLEITKKLKALAEEIQITILVNTALKRKMERRASKIPLLTDMQSDFRFHVDLVLLLYRESCYSNQEWSENRAMVIVAWDRISPIKTGFFEKHVFLKFEDGQFVAY